MSTNRLIIFDTTMRDGEQSPGASMTRDEKLRIARALERMKVDVIEAGFPASSNGDFEAVRAIANVVKDSTVCGLCRAAVSVPAGAAAHSRRRGLRLDPPLRSPGRPRTGTRAGPERRLRLRRARGGLALRGDRPRQRFLRRSPHRPAGAGRGGGDGGGERDRPRRIDRGPLRVRAPRGRLLRRPGGGGDLHPAGPGEPGREATGAGRRSPTWRSSPLRSGRSRRGLDCRGGAVPCLFAVRLKGLNRLVRTLLFLPLFTKKGAFT